LNTLQATDGTFRLVDPDDLLAEPAYDLAIVMRKDAGELMSGDPRQRSRRLAELSGLDEMAIWEWGALERL